jgi:serine phosphatase RsbU (regulator of sigma subunit)
MVGQAKLPSAPGLCIHVAYYPASNESESGDWYDAVNLPDGRIFFSIGDAEGHGPKAAHTMGLARNALLAAADTEADPAKILERAHTVLAKQDSARATALCGVFIPGSAKVRLASAGHPLPVVVREGIRIEPLTGSHGLLFGADPNRALGARNTEWSALHFLFAKALLVLYTDGVTGRDPKGEEILHKAAVGAANAQNPAEAVYKQIFGGKPHEDDVTILTLAIRLALAGP